MIKINFQIQQLPVNKLKVKTKTVTNWSTLHILVMKKKLLFTGKTCANANESAKTTSSCCAPSERQYCFIVSSGCLMTDTDCAANSSRHRCYGFHYFCMHDRLLVNDIKRVNRFWFEFLRFSRIQLELLNKKSSLSKSKKNKKFMKINFAKLRLPAIC